MGQTDANRHFHLRGIGISTRSTSNVGEFLMTQWKINVIMEDQIFEPVAYLGDAAAAFANAAYRVFPTIVPETRLMCFAHVYKVYSWHYHLISTSFHDFHFLMERTYFSRFFFFVVCCCLFVGTYVRTMPFSRNHYLLLFKCMV